MKLNLLALAGLLSLFSCTDSATSTSTSDNATAAEATPEETVNYAYTLKNPHEWEWGSKKNTETALAALKGFETANIDGTMQYWADSVVLEFDNFEKKVSNDSLKAMFNAWRAGYTDIQINMDDWESVISKDKEWEWVSLWYKQISTNTKGEVDSVDCMDDLRFKDGKIVLLSEKTRKLGPPKK